MMDSGGSGSSNSINTESVTGEEWMNGIASNKEVSPPQQKGHPCKDSYSHLPHCNTSLSKEKRVQYIISRLNTKEKISLLGHDSPSIKHTDLYLPEYKWWNEGLHGRKSAFVFLFALFDHLCKPHVLTCVTITSFIFINC